MDLQLPNANGVVSHDTKPRQTPITAPLAVYSQRVQRTDRQPAERL